MDSIVERFKKEACDRIEIVADGHDRFLIFLPVTFDDGDTLPVVLKRVNNGWVLSDEGQSLLHLSYAVSEEELRRGARNEILERTLSAFQMKNDRGELIMPLTEGAYGEALYDFMHALFRIDDIRFLSRERVTSTD